MSGMKKELVFEMSKGFRGRRNNTIKAARGAVNKALQHAHRNRKQNHRNARRMWIMRVNAGVREHGFVYSTFMHGLNQANINLNRKMLSQLAISEPLSFASIIHQVKEITGLLPRPQRSYGYVKSGLAVNVPAKVMHKEAKKKWEQSLVQKTGRDNVGPVANYSMPPPAPPQGATT